MKLNYKRTILVGFAFFLICAFWQAYDNTVPLILTNKFGMSQTWSGVIMAMDNVLALFLLPLFGHISDKCTHPRGRRTPFIVVGTLIAAGALLEHLAGAIAKPGFPHIEFAADQRDHRIGRVGGVDIIFRHGGACDAEPVGELLLREAESFAQLLCSGCYGHRQHLLSRGTLTGNSQKVKRKCDLSAKST